MRAQTTAPEPAIVARAVRRTFATGRRSPPVEAVRGVDLEVRRGEFLALMGPSGSGKTTLLNLLGCLDSPTGGEIIVLGHDVTSVPKARLAQFRLRHIGFVFQRFNLIEHLTALENVALPLCYLRPRMSARDRNERAMLALEAVGLSERWHHRPDQLSGGEQQRVGIARALVHDPDIILADEPTGELDTATGAEIVRLLTGLRDTGGRTLIVVTHDPAIAENADRAVRMVDGIVE